MSESGLFLTLGSGTSSAQNENRRPLFNRNIPLISGKYGFRNHFWPLESGFSWGKMRKRALTFEALCSWFQDLHIWNCLAISENLPWKNYGYFFSIRRVFRTHVNPIHLKRVKNGKGKPLRKKGKHILHPSFVHRWGLWGVAQFVQDWGTVGKKHTLKGWETKRMTWVKSIAVHIQCS